MKRLLVFGLIGAILLASSVDVRLLFLFWPLGEIARRFRDTNKKWRAEARQISKERKRARVKGKELQRAIKAFEKKSAKVLATEHVQTNFESELKWVNKKVGEAEAILSRTADPTAKGMAKEFYQDITLSYTLPILYYGTAIVKLDQVHKEAQSKEALDEAKHHVTQAVRSDQFLRSNEVKVQIAPAKRHLEKALNTQDPAIRYQRSKSAIRIVRRIMGPIEMAAEG